MSGLDGPGSDRSPDEQSLLLQKPEQRGCWSVLKARTKKYGKDAWSFAKSKTGQGVFKCSIAYLLGSLATFVPAIADVLGQQDGKHIVATITVYFHPARSKGSMLEAVFCALAAFAYAVFICFGSMAVSIFSGRTLDLIVVGHTIVLVVFCGGGLGFVGWIKQRLGHPLINISCSLTSLAIITVLTKEGAVQAAEFSDDKVVQVMIMIAMGVTATTAVSLLISPTSARRELKEDLIQITDSFSDLLTIITRAFLSGSEGELQQHGYNEASEKNKKVFTSLTKNLKEAKYEYYIAGKEKQYQLQARLANCMQRLAQSIGGLRSAATTQFLLLSQAGVTRTNSPMSTGFASTPNYSSFPSLAPSLAEESGVLASIDETQEDGSRTPEDGPLEDSQLAHLPLSDDESLGGSTFGSASDIFTKFILHLGPSMVSSFSM